MKSTQKGISIRLLTLIFAIITGTFFAALVLLSFSVYKRFCLVQTSIDKFFVCQESSNTIKDSAGYLTEQARLFVITHNPEYAKAYLEEKDVKKRREKALEQLQKACGTDDLAYQRIQIAQGQAENLVSIEIYAIKLVYEGCKTLADDTPESITSVKLRDVDQNLSSDELCKLAKNTLFGDGYLIYQRRVNENCNQTIKSIQEEISNNLKINSDSLDKNLKLSRWLLISLFVILVLLFIFFEVLVLRILKKFTNSIEKDERLQVQGAAELKYLAETYNGIYEIKARNEKELLFDAEYDALTGILNRRAYEQICKKCAEEKDHIALLLIDMDNFKNINDTYGHAGGDTALKELAKILKSTFRRSDYVCRIGGDEFAAILRGLKAKPDEAIVKKIRYVNEVISEITGGIRHVSISVGAAISDEGYTPELYEKADKALYYVKQHGRSGCKIYDETCEETIKEDKK